MKLLLPFLASAAILVFELIVLVVVVDMFFPVVLSVIQRVKVSLYVMIDTKRYYNVIDIVHNCFDHSPSLIPILPYDKRYNGLR